MHRVELGPNIRLSNLRENSRQDERLQEAGSTLVTSRSCTYPRLLHYTRTYGIGKLELYHDTVTRLGVSMYTYTLRPYYPKAGHLSPNREFVGKRDIEYQIGTVGQSVKYISAKASSHHLKWEWLRVFIITSIRHLNG